MTVLVYAALIAGAAVFAVACAVRARAYARMPIHLRWEIYPVPHEDPARARHGGSYFEQVDWWTKKSRFGLLGEVAAMVPEMLFMRVLFQFNRKLWYRSFPFHLGLYLLVGACGLVLLAALLGLAFPSAMAGAPGLALHWAYVTAGAAGLISSIAGALLLLGRRFTDPALRASTTPGDVANLLFFVAAFALLGAGLLARPADSPGALAIVRGLLVFDTGLEVPPLLSIAILLCALLAAYIPMTHMAHFVGKYFTYHAVRWDDRPLVAGRAMERRLVEYLTYRPTWAASHVAADGSKTWAEVAGSNPWEGGKK